MPGQDKSDLIRRLLAELDVSWPDLPPGPRFRPSLTTW